MAELSEGDCIEAYNHRRLEELRKIADAGSALAIPAALDYCAEHDVTPPQWLTERASKLLNALLHVEDQTVRKRMRRQITDYRKRQVHFARYDAVNAAKEARVDLRNESKHVKPLKSQNAWRIAKNLKLVLERLGPNDETVVAAVAHQLKKTSAAGGEEAIRKSYQKLLKEEREDRMNGKYYVFDPLFLRRIGVNDRF